MLPAARNTECEGPAVLPAVLQAPALQQSQSEEIGAAAQEGAGPALETAPRRSQAQGEALPDECHMPDESFQWLQVFAESHERVMVMEHTT